MKMKSESLWDMQRFHSRLIIRGQLHLKTGLRIGAGRDTAVESATDLSVVKDVYGKPYIPGASFKGAWRSATEALLRGQFDDQHNVACLSVPREQDTAGPPAVCLTQASVSYLKALPENEIWQKLADSRAEYDPKASLDANLRALSCWVCRVFGAPWLAGKLLVKDLLLPDAWADLVQFETRDGVTIDRDTGRAADKKKYAYEVVAAQTPFTVEIIVDNASEAELGLIWLGLRAVQQGWISLGGARSRGLGQCSLDVDWDKTQWITSADLLNALFPDTGQPAAGLLGTQGVAWSGRCIQEFLYAVQGGQYD